MDPAMKKPYVSCIRINGVPILPPLMTDEKRREIAQIRLKVAEVEKRISAKNTKKNLIVLDDKHATSTPQMNIQPKNNFMLLDSPPKTIQSLEHHLVFDDVLPICDSSHLRNSKSCELAPSNSFYEYKDNSNYLDDTVGVNVTFGLNNSNISNTNYEDNCMDSNIDVAVYDADVEDKSNQFPRLIRSNSYVLDGPSPLLMNYLKKQENLIDMTAGTVECKNNRKQEIKEMQKSHLNHGIFQNETDIINEVIENNFTPTATPKKIAEDKMESRLHHILHNIPNQYSEELLSIFNLMKSRNNVNESVRHEEIITNSPSNSECYGTYFDNISFGTSSQTLYYSVSSSNETVNTYTVMENDSFKSPLETITKPQFPNGHNYDKNWAASKINAAVRSYLVRRLMNTEKVQDLKQTIKDAVICAMELHGVIDITPSDVELHRRLLQQVTAAHYEIYETFFDLSTSEKMKIIASDRQRKLDKMNKSQSSSSNGSLHSGVANKPKLRRDKRKH